MNYKKLVPLLIAAVAICAVSVKPAMAYFTDYVWAVGHKTIHVADSKLETPTDEVDLKTMVKTVALTNSGDYPVYVRVKAVTPDNFTIDMQNSDSWIYNANDGYYYFEEILNSKEKTKDLNLKITVPDNYKEDFNVVILQEATKVHYDSDGKEYANWSETINP